MQKIMKTFLVAVMLVMSVSILVSCDENTTVKDEVTITFETGVENIKIPSIKGVPGKNIPTVDEPERDGYKFKQWNDEDGNYFRLTRFPEKSITLTAVWEKLTDLNGEYKIAFLTNSNQYIQPIKLNVGDAIPKLPIPEYFESNGLISSFNNWYFENEVFNLKIMPQKNITLIAQWNTGDKAIFFETESSETIQPIVADANEKISAPNFAPIKEGHIFKGWKYNNLPYIFEKMPNMTITVQPDWLKISDDINNEITNIPKMFIELGNNYPLTSVSKETYINSSITIANAGSDDVNAIGAEFKGRGNGSWTESGPKRGYRIKLFNKQKMFGEASSKHWVLLAGANFYDPTLLKTRTAFDLSRELFDNIQYTSSTNWVELYVNGEYRGIYIFAEHQRVDKERVNIKSEFGKNDTGYFIEYDSYANQEGPEGIFYFNIPGFQHGFTVKSPDPDDYLDENISEAVFRGQVAFIKDYMTTTLQAALNAASDPSQYAIFEANVDVASFVDMYILHELFKNADTGWSSFNMHKAPGGKLYANAPWDFDASAGKNRGNQSPEGIYVAGSVAHESSHTASELYIALLKVDKFRSEVVKRWKELSPKINKFINDYLSDDFIDANKVALSKNYYYWSENRNNVSGPNPPTTGAESQYLVYGSLSAAETGWVSHTKSLRNWLVNRIVWLNSEWN